MSAEGHDLNTWKAEGIIKVMCILTIFWNTWIFRNTDSFWLSLTGKDFSNVDLTNFPVQALKFGQSEEFYPILLTFVLDLELMVMLVTRTQLTLHISFQKVLSLRCDTKNLKKSQDQNVTQNFDIQNRIFDGPITFIIAHCSWIKIVLEYNLITFY